MSNPSEATEIVELIRRSREAGDFNILTDAIPYMKFLGIETAIEEGTITTTMRYSRRLIGNVHLPALHGGTIGALLETAAIVQLAHDLDTAHLPKTIGITVEYMRTGRPIDLHAKAVVTKRGRRVANMRAVAWSDNPDKPVATAHGHFLLS